MVNIYYWTQCNIQKFLYLCVKNVLDTAEQTDWVFSFSGNSYRRDRIKKMHSVLKFQTSIIYFFKFIY